MWGVLLSTVAIGVSQVLGKKKGTDSSSSSTSSSRLALLRGGDQVFVSGVVLGLGLSLLYATTIKQFRLTERLKFIWYTSWWWDSDKTKAPLRQPVRITETGGEYLIETAAGGDGGSVRLLVSPSMAATSSLHVSLICIPPGREIFSVKARAVEFYYVVSGSGLFSQQGVNETGTLHQGDGFVVDPGSMRWISNSNKSSGDDLLLLRACDGGNHYDRYDVIRKDPNNHPIQPRTLEETVAALRGSFKSLLGYK